MSALGHKRTLTVSSVEAMVDPFLVWQLKKGKM
jgi:hypothetical protein